MNELRSQNRVAEALREGPRGRRLLLEFALASERLSGRDASMDSLGAAVTRAAHHLDPNHGSMMRFFGTGTSAPEPATVSPDSVAERLERLPLSEVTPRLLLLCLCRSVDMARYWQDPDGEDLLAATSPVRAALRRVSEHVASSPETHWWCTPVDQRSQCAVQWEGQPPSTIPADPLAALRAARASDVAKEREAARERPADPAALFGGEWWSRPTWDVPSSARELFDGSPAALWLVEDSLGWETAETTHLDVPQGLRVFEVDTATAWAELCARFPLEQTGQKRHEWYRTTGRVGRWVIPDWAAVAEHYDGVHLQVGAYLAAAGTAIAVDADTASVIAGWGPDETYWFTPRIRHLDDPQAWTLEEDAGEYVWVRVE